MAVARKNVAPADEVDTEAMEKARRARLVRAPVGWLLGPELLGQLKKILRSRSDPRDWMPYYRGCVHDECWKRDGSLVRVVEVAGPVGPAGGLASSRSEAPGAPARSPMQSAERTIPVDKPTAPAEAEADAWFDYVADMGDGGDAMYAVAYAAMVSFDGDDATATWPAGSDRKPLRVTTAGAQSTLPRGQFLFVGGDSAYHVADAATLRARVEQPFGWAFEDARARGHIAAKAQLGDRRRRIYGIPGNHDWYDNLEGFSQVFRLGSASSDREAKHVNPIQLPELERVQLASYLAIQLPYGWQLWGVDIDSKMDARQLAYFKSLKARGSDRLIFATPSPAIAFGASIADAKHVDATTALEIPIPEVPIAAGATTTPKYRLDLSGDVHHYARYYPRDGVATYGSVVSGLGGAFHHPSFTRASSSDQRIEAVREYPTCPDSRDRIAERLLTWKSAWFGSWARVIPFVLTLLCGFAASYSVGGSWLFDHLLSVLPGFSLRPSNDGGRQLLHALCGVTVFLIAVGGVIGGCLFARSVHRTQVDKPETVQSLLDVLRNPRWYKRLLSVRRSYWFAWTIGVVAIAPFVLYPLWGPESRTPRLDVATLLVVFGLPILGGWVGWWFSASHLARLLKPGLGIVGFVHAAAHVITAVMFARLFTVSGWTVAAGVGAFLIAASMLHVARPLFKHSSRWCIALLTALALAVFAISIALIVVAARGEYVIRSLHWYSDALRFAISGVVAMPLGTTWFIWYLAVAGRLDAHNNEVGGAARVTKYRELIRFRVHRGGLTGYVIAVENCDDNVAVHEGGTNLEFSLIDVFTIAAPAAASPLLRSTPLAGDADDGLS